MPVMPVAIPWHKVRRAVRRRLRALGFVPGQSLDAWQRLEDQALLDYLFQAARYQARGVTGRNSARSFAQYMTRPEGRRVERAMRVLSEKLGRAEAGLCSIR